MNAQLSESGARYDTTTLAVPVAGDDHIRGDPNATVTLVVYADFQSPECAAAYRTLQSIPRDFRMSWRFVFRHLPTARNHETAMTAAEAAEAAAAQGLFWDLHDAMFENQGALSADFIRKLARRLGMNLERYDADMRSHRFADKIKRDMDGAARSGAVRAPVVYIDDVRFDRPLEEKSLKAALAQRIAAANPRSPLAAAFLR